MCDKGCVVGINRGKDLPFQRLIAELNCAKPDDQQRKYKMCIRDSVTPVAFDRLIGEVVFQIPMLGNLSTCLYTGTGIMACSGLFVTVAVLWGIAEKFKLKESAK